MNGSGASSNEHEGDVTDPVGLLRIAAMVTKVRDELKMLDLDASAAARLNVMANGVRNDLAQTISPSLVAELDRLVPPRSDEAAVGSSPAEAALVHAQLAGWIEGVVQSLQLQAAFARNQAQERRAEPPQPTRRRDADDHAYL